MWYVRVTHANGYSHTVGYKSEDEAKATAWAIQQVAQWDNLNIVVEVRYEQ